MKDKYPYFLIIPSFCYIIVFFIFPLIWLIIIAFSNIDLRTWNFRFIGINNFVDIIKEEEFIPSLNRTVVYASYISIVGTVIGLLLSLLANQRIRGIGILRSILIIPWSIPYIIVGYLWQWIFDANFGFINRLFYALGIISEYKVFITKDSALLVVGIPVIWAQSAFTALMCLSALQGVPPEIYEASEIDGASGVSRFLYITLPYIRPIFALTFLLNLMTGLIMFDVVYIMTAGGPGTSTLTIPILLYREGFLRIRIPQAAALAVIHLLIILLLGSIYLLILYKKRV